MIKIHKSTPAPTFLTNLCTNSSTYIANSTFSNNLDTLLRSLSSNATTNPTGFYTTVVGNGTNAAAYGAFMCRGDQTMSGCSDCVATAVRDQPKTSTCSRSKREVILYDECMVRYDNQSFARRVDEEPKFVQFNSLGEGFEFENFLGSTVDEIAVQAANSSQINGKKYAVTARNYSSLRKLYALEQCMPDLMANDCKRCLDDAIKQLSVRQGGKVSFPSCNVRYETYPFFNGADNLTSPPLPSPSPASTNSTRIQPEPSRNGKWTVSAKVVTAILASITAILVALHIVSICFRNNKDKKNYAIQNGANFATMTFLQFDMDTLKSATNDFSDENKLGEGGFGVVYKGKLSNGQEIAVKRLSKSSRQGVQEFKNEVLLIAMLQHRNLVKLLGFCLDDEEKLLVYEFVPNRSLDNFLLDPKKREQLDWGMRYDIIRGIARGMLFLHEDSRHKIIHRDLKASNILLDADMNPKVSDFGLARIFGVDQTHISTSKVVGTYGYLAPEYALLGKFSTKSDVYSFGVLILEIISGNRNSNLCQSDHGQDLLSLAWNHWRNSKLLEFVDPCIRHGCSCDEVTKCMNLGLLCVQDKADDRPTMATIVIHLNTYFSNIQVPKKPVLFFPSESETMSNVTVKTNELDINSIPNLEDTSFD